MRRLVIATRNQGKLREVQALLAGLAYEVVALDAYPDTPDVEETGATFEENAVLKAKAYSQCTGEITLADDSGLVVDALDGAPGVMSSRFAPTDAERIAKLLDRLRDIPDEARSARFICAIAVAQPRGEVRTCEGRVEGVIAREARGANGFGYDPVFLVPDLGRTMAELSHEEKNAISHRGRALAEAVKML